MTTFRRLVTVAAAMLTMNVPRLVAAEEVAPRVKAATDANKEPKSASGGSKEAKAPAKASRKRVLRLEELKVEGRIQKPQAMFLMPRANLNFGDLERGESFVPRLREPLQSPPF